MHRPYKHISGDEQIESRDLKNLYMKKDGEKEAGESTKWCIERVRLVSWCFKPSQRNRGKGNRSLKTDGETV